MVDVVNLVRIQIGLIDGGVRRRLNDAEHDALVLCRRQFPLRKHVERNHQRGDDRPYRQHHRPEPQRAGQIARVSSPDPFKQAIDHACEATVGRAFP